MSTTNSQFIKRPYKFIEIPLNKFKNEAIPHHQELFMKHKTNARKLTNSGDYEQLQREIIDKERIIRQLKELTYELDTLRKQVNNSDLKKFDEQTLPLRKIILDVINGYESLEILIRTTIEEHYETQDKYNLENTSQLQLHADIEALKLQETEDQSRLIEAINRDIENVHDIFHNLNEMVSTQKEHVDNIEINTEVADDNIKGGVLHLIKASRFQKASYPITGAFIGGLVGGPIGAVAGIKVAALAAIGCGICGYVGGRIFRKANDVELLKTEMELQDTSCTNILDNNRGLPISTSNDKKDI